MAFTTYQKEQVLNAYFTTQTLYLGLLKDNGEVNASGYERMEMTFTAPIENSGVVYVENAEMIEFEPAESDWGIVTQLAVFDSATGGNIIDVGEISNPANVLEGRQFWIDAGGYKVELE